MGFILIFILLIWSNNLSLLNINLLQMIIRKNFNDLTLDDLYRILRARQEVFTVEQEIVYQDLDFIDQSAIHLFLQIPEDKEIKAYMRIIPPGIKYPEASMGRLLTISKFRNQGLARDLMIEAIGIAKNLYGLPIKIEAQEYLVKFYESIGFKAISEPFILEGISHVEMIMD